MGKRTKHQIQDYAQLMLIAKSNLCLQDDKSITHVVRKECNEKLKEEIKVVDSDEPVSEGGWVHSEFEVGRRVVKESSTGEEISLRRILLDATDGGPAENILLEEGVRYTDSTLNTTGAMEGGGGRGGILHEIDQAVILAQCLDVKNSNPVVSELNISFVFTLFHFTL